MSLLLACLRGVWPCLSLSLSRSLSLSLSRSLALSFTLSLSLSLARVETSSRLHLPSSALNLGAVCASAPVQEFHAVAQACRRLLTQGLSSP